jgi:hypothetical protein
MKLPRSKSLAVTALASTLVLAATSATTTAGADAATSHPSTPRVLASGLGPVFQIALRHHTVYYTDGATVSKITPSGPKVVAPFADASGVEFSRNGKTMAVAYGSPESSPQQVTLVRKGRPRITVSTIDYENKVNPDRHQKYGIVAGGNAECLTEVEKVSGGPATYKGIKDSHPYQVAALRGGAFAIAEAGGNDILRVGPQGRISTIAVLPPQPVTLTAEQATGLGAPHCAGATYAFESVPTDVERGPHGSLLVSTLPGGPEDPTLGARGSVYKISRHGHVKRLATGFAGATNLATFHGRIYVAELFGGKVTKLYRGHRSTQLTIDSPLSVEATRKKLYVGTLPGESGPGQIVSISRYKVGAVPGPSSRRR